MVQNNLVLVGMMGSGKSLIGQLLAEKLGRDFLDTDQLVEELADKTIVELIATQGEEKFRQLESQVVLKVATQTNLVIATGGGVVLKEENVSRLRKKGMIIFLTASPKIICQRLQGDNQRPLLQVEDPQLRIEELLEERLPLYQQAAMLKIETDLLSSEEVVLKILQEIDKFS